MSVFEGTYMNSDGDVMIRLDAENDSDFFLSGLLTSPYGDVPLTGTYVPRDSSHERYLYSLCGSMKFETGEVTQPPDLFRTVSIVGATEWNNEKPSLQYLSILFSFALDKDGYAHDVVTDGKSTVYSRVPD